MSNQNIPSVPTTDPTQSLKDDPNVLDKWQQKLVGKKLLEIFPGYEVSEPQKEVAELDIAGEWGSNYRILRHGHMGASDDEEQKKRLTVVVDENELVQCVYFG